MTTKQAKGLYDPSFERDSCGFGLIANLDDTPSHFVVETAISASMMSTETLPPYIRSLISETWFRWTDRESY